MFDDVGDAVRFALAYRELAAPLVTAIRARAGSGPVFVGICGRSRAGKSVIAHALVRSLREAGEDCLHVRLDDWIMPAAERGPRDTAEIRNRVDRLPAIFAALRKGEKVTAPGYDAANRVAGPPVTYDAAGCAVIVVDGVLAAHPSIRPLAGLAAFVDIPRAVERSRFTALYRWKQFADPDIEALWRARSGEEWAVVDAQRGSCDVVLAPAGSQP
jgi:uridine kinase